MSKLLIKYCLLLLILSLSLINSYAQFDKIGYPFRRNFQRSEYQAGLQSWMMSESNERMMYFANNEGLMEFDGLNWNLYPVPNRTIVRSVYADDSGKIYVGCSNNLGWFEKDDTGKMKFKSLLNLIDPNNRNFGEIWKIHDTGNSIIFQSYHQIMIYKNNSIKLIKAPELFHFSYYINDQLIITDNEKGVFKLDGLKLQSLPGTELLTDKQVCSAFSLNDKILFATTHYGVYLFDGQKLNQWNTITNDFLIQNQIYCALRVNEDYIAFGTIQGGLIICTNEGIPVLTINESNGLQNNTILCMEIDNDNNLWLGTDNGISLIYINLPLSFLNHWQNLSAGYTAVIYDDILYLGTNRGVFYKKWDECNQYPTRFTDFKLIETAKGQVWKLQVIDNHLFCGHNDGIFLIKGTDAEKISNVPGAWTFLQFKREPDKIICGTYSGLILLKKINGKWIFSERIKGFEESSRMMEVDKDESIWMSHGYKGVYNINLNETLDSVSSVQFYDSLSGFNTNYGINVTKLKDQIVFLSSKGIFQYNDSSDRMEPSENFNKFFLNKKINYAYEDQKGDIWYFHNNNLAVKRVQEDGGYLDISLPFKPVQGKFIEGFQFVYPINQNHVLIGYEDGFIHYNPNLIVNYQKEFKVFIRQIKVSKNDSILFDGHIFKSTGKVEKLKYKDNNLHFFFSAVGFESNEQTVFSTFLKGYDNVWSNWENRLDREFTNLKEGDYAFYIKARNIYNVETEPIIYKFSIEPPWYRTRFAYYIYILLFLTLTIIITYFVQRRIKYLRIQEIKRQKQKYIEREKELQKESLIAEKELIKLRNDKLRQEMKMKNEELADSTMQTIQKNKSLINIKKDIKSVFSNSKDEYINNKLKKIVKKIDSDINNEDNWKVFEKHFSNVHEEFLKKLKNEYPDISPAELRLCACLRMNISTKEISSLLNISVRGVEASRYRLRKHLNLDRKTNLTDFILSY